LLRIPKETDVTPLLMTTVRRAVAGESSSLPESVPEPERGTEVELKRNRKRVKKRRKGKSSSEDDDHAWENVGEIKGSAGGSKRQMRWMLLGGVALFLVCLAGVIFSIRSAPTASPLAASAAEVPAVTAELKPAGRSDEAVLVEAEPLVKTFLEAGTIEELLPVVRNPEVAEPRMRKFYPDGRITPPMMSEFNSNRVLLRKDSFIAVSVRTGAQEERQLAMVETPDGLQIDWEAWVAWSEVSWPDFLESQATTPSIFRLIVEKVDYYNFDFLDDDQWRSYRLVSREGDYTVYGYVQKGTELDKKLRLDADVKKLPMILSLKFPAAPKSKNQVEIVELIAEGWVEK